MQGRPVLTRGPNIQVTHDPSPDNARSESVLMVNPRNPLNMVGSSKRFTSPATYQFTLNAYATHNGGYAWDDIALDPPYGSDFLSDPAVAFDDIGTAYLLGHIWNNGPTARIYKGLALYQSSDEGRNWTNANVIYTQYADKQWIAGDMTPSSPHHGNVYAAWDGGGGIQFARTQDHGLSWTGIKNAGVSEPVGSLIAPNGHWASICVAPNGTLYIFYLTFDLQGLAQVNMVTSSDGGDTFSSPSATAAQVATGIVPIASKLPASQFRLESIHSSCVSGSNLVVAWPAYLNGVSRIFYRRSNNGGASWLGSSSGDLLTAAEPSGTDQHDFMPQLAATAEGKIGCCFHEFGPKFGYSTPRIDVVVMVSTDSGATFDNRLTVTDQSWDPTVDAPTDTDGSKFIGDYFGFAAGPIAFNPFWTDTRTGVQEIFTCSVALVSPKPRQFASWAQILFGIINDGGGVEIVGGHIVHVPPRPPEIGMLTSILVAELARSIPGPEGKAVRKAALQAVAAIALKESTSKSK